MKIKAVVFDLDGTLTDSAAGICETFATVLAEAGHPEPDPVSVAAMIGLPLRSIFVRFATTADDGVLDGLVDRYKRLYTETVIPRTCLFPHAWSLLRACRAAELELGLVTAKSTDVAVAVLRRCRVHGLFGSVVGGDRAERPKPHPDLLWVALRELDVPAAETLVVGDADHDIGMARAAGAKTCGVAWGVHGPERLRAAGADWVVHTPRELRALLLDSPTADG